MFLSGIYKKCVISNGGERSPKKDFSIVTKNVTHFEMTNKKKFVEEINFSIVTKM